MKTFKRIAILSLIGVVGITSYALSNPGFILAGSAQINDLMAFGMPAQLASLVDAQYGTAVEASIIPSADNSIDLGTSAKAFRSAYIDTSVQYGSTAQPVFLAASVMTPSTGVPTPAAGNTLSERNTIIAAGAPTAAFIVLPLATLSVGKSYTVYNQGSNPVAIVPQTGVVNVSAALTPFSCTTLKECKCTGLTTGVFGCSQQ